ncbi:MAG TPA: 50S ribosomal protein L30 [Clostridiaceae bacterium]|jgi:large subunit ribosomal protein L30|nr:50S ribosomal protein L30 [Clostridiaceae bacterium]
MGNLRITLKKSTIASKEDQKATVVALGLRKIGQSVVQKDNAQIRGMINKVSHLVEVEEL